MTLAEELRAIGLREVVDDLVALQGYSQDASLFTMQPQVAVFPQSVRELQLLVDFVYSQREAGRDISLTARAAGTDMSGGPLTTSIVVIFTKHFNHLKNIEQQQAIVEPGMYYRDFERATLQHDLLMPSYPASRELCTVGGMVSNNSGGEKTLRYGKTDRYVNKLKVILDDGHEYSFTKLQPAELAAKMNQEDREGLLYRDMYELLTKHAVKIKKARPTVTKNSAGYALWDVIDPQSKTFDLTHVLTGSQGTLGLLSEITFDLVHPEHEAALLVIFLNDLQQLADIVNRVLAQKPESFESYDDQTLKVALKTLPALLKQMGGNALTMGFRFIPELWMTVRNGLPKLVLLAEFTAKTSAEALQKAKAAQAALTDLNLTTRVTSSVADRHKYWTIRRESFNLLRHQVQGLHTAPFIDDFVVSPQYLPEFLPQLYSILDEYKLLYTVAGHVGEGNFHIIPLVDMADPTLKTTIRTLSQRVYQLVLKYHGSITGEHNDGLVRGPYLEEAFGKEMYQLFIQTKHIFDPQGIFNPHKKINVTWEYASHYLQTTKPIEALPHAS